MGDRGGRGERGLQAAFGFDDCHMHCFEALGADGPVVRSHHPAGSEHLGMETEPAAAPTHEVFLLEALPRTGAGIGCGYDFGDDWRIFVERVEPAAADPAGSGVGCLGGERAGPPEGTGGVWGYAELLEEKAALPADRGGDDPDDERPQLLRWLRPEPFHAGLMNRDLRRFLVERRRPAKPGRWG